MNEEEKILRDRIAIAILPALVDDYNQQSSIMKPTPGKVCTTAYVWADLMLKARKES